MSGVIVSFTATRKLVGERLERHRPYINETLSDLVNRAYAGEIDEFDTGAAEGGDTVIAETLLPAWPEGRHRLLVPAAPHNRDHVWRWEYNARHDHTGICLVEHVPPVPGPPAAQYKERDKWLVERAGAGGGWLVAFALHEERRMPRSGTWLTVRLARTAGVRVDLHILEPEPTLL